MSELDAGLDLENEIFERGRKKGVEKAMQEVIDVSAAQKVGREIGKEMAMYQSFAEAVDELKVMDREWGDQRKQMQFKTFYRIFVQLLRSVGYTQGERVGLKKSFRELLGCVGMLASYREELQFKDITF